MLHALDAAAVRRWYAWGLAALGATRAEIDSLNVFPVPDADTGTNLYLTLESAADDGRATARAGLAETATAMAKQSLLGARGSSGVILSQLLRGVAEVLAAPGDPPRGFALTRALERGVALAYAAVAQPVEGTMLTVARVAAEAARASGTDDLPAVVDAAASAAHRALAETPRQLEVLARAGVVDAGGRGIVVLLDVLQAVVAQRPLPQDVPQVAHPALDRVAQPGAAAQRYEVMYLVDADDDHVPALRAALAALGDDVVVSGGDGLWNVHVHTDDAGSAVDRGLAFGHPRQIRIHRIAGPGGASGHAHGGPPDGAPGSGSASGAGAGHQRALVVVAPAGPLPALRAALAAAGARAATSAVDLVTAIRQHPHAAEAAVLTLSEPGLLAAVEAAAGALHGRQQLEIVPARSPVQILAALAVHDAGRSLGDDTRAMTEAVAAVRCAEVRRDPAGFVGVLDGDLALRGDDAHDLAVRLVDRMLADPGELVTVVAAPDLAGRLAASLRAAHPGVEVSCVPGELDDVWLGVE